MGKSVAPNLDAYFALLEKDATDELRQVGGGDLFGALGAFLDPAKTAAAEKAQKAVNEQLQGRVCAHTDCADCA